MGIKGVELFKAYLQGRTKITNYDLILAYIFRRLEQDYNVSIIIDGLTGTGKSYLAYKIYTDFYAAYERLHPEKSEIVKYFKRLFFVPPILSNLSSDILKDLIGKYYEVTEEILSKNFTSDDPIPVLCVFDEAIQVLYKREAMTKTNRMLIKLINLIRKYKLNMIYVIPDMFHLDVAVRQNRDIDLWIHVHTRRKEGSIAYVYNLKNTVYRYPAQEIIRSIRKYGSAGFFHNPWYICKIRTEYIPELYNEYKKQITKFSRQELGKVYGQLLQLYKNLSPPNNVDVKR